MDATDPSRKARGAGTTSLEHWRARLWTPGRPGRPTPPDVVALLYTGWLVAFALKVLGSSWDVSWHFRWLRDDLAPPHLLNSAGTALVVGLVAVHSYTGQGVDRIALRWMQWGIGLFLVAVPLDIVNHRLFGLDITSWSPTHAVLYLGTAVMLVGVLRGWSRAAEPGRRRNVVLLLLWLFFLENVLFPNQHQEYGVLSLRAYRAGTPTAEPILLDFARSQGSSPEQFMLPVPSWVHPLWLVGAGLLTLLVLRRTSGIRWSATLVAAGYIGYRLLAWVALVGAGFPPSAVPVLLVAGALAIDLAVDRGTARGRGGWPFAPVVVVVTYAAAWVQSEVAVLPPWAWWTAPIAAVLFTAQWYAVDRVLLGRRVIASDRPRRGSPGEPEPMT